MIEPGIRASTHDSTHIPPINELCTTTHPLLATYETSFLLSSISAPREVLLFTYGDDIKHYIARTSSYQLVSNISIMHIVMQVSLLFFANSVLSATYIFTGVLCF